MPVKTYWNGCGTYEELGEKLHALIPAMGEVENPRKNPKLEKYRKAVNCYYDLYNNGLCNRAKQFYHIFKIASTHYRFDDGWTYGEILYVMVEKKMDVIIREALIEQEMLKND